MLVLTRSANQSIMIGHDVVVTVLEVRGDQVRLGIKAPRSTGVHREEVYAQLQRQNRSAAAPSAGALSELASRAAGGPNDAGSRDAAPSPPVAPPPS